MPTYHYRCKNCSFEFEELQKISDEPITLCPSCQKETVVRVLSGGAGLLFKGSGFYQTDYKKGGGAATKRTPENPEKSPESSGGSKGDSPSDGKTPKPPQTKSTGDAGGSGSTPPA